MALWGKTDATPSIPKYLNATDAAKAFFIDKDEAVQPENIAKGLDSAGWWLYTTYTDSASVVRHKAELLVAMSSASDDVSAANAGDRADDAVAVDRTITIGTQPADTDILGAGTDATFAVVASVDPATTITYQWEVSVDTGANWTVIAGATAATLVVAGTTPGPADAEYVDLNQFRVVVSSDGATDVTSSAAILTL
jgi:hypothetical protein